MILSSGLRLQSLLQHEITTILQQELDNDAAIHLYSTGTHWVAFEHSAYQLCRQYPDADLTPFFFDTYPSLNGRLTLKAPKLNLRQYRAWHRREVKQFEDILE